MNGCFKNGKPKLLSTKPCKLCGNTFMMKQKSQEYCSRKCSAKVKAEAARVHTHKQCLWCGQMFRRKRRKVDATLYCSRECSFEQMASDKRKREELRDRFEPQLSILRSCISKVNATNRLLNKQIHKDKALTGPCDGCGIQMRYKRIKNPCKMCDDCDKERKAQYRRDARKNHKIPPSKAIKRARFYGVEYEPVQPAFIMKRDKYTCQLCGCHTPRDKRGTYDDDAPELDHIVPISKGGPHTKDNIQLACRRCNAEKGDQYHGGDNFF